MSFVSFAEELVRRRSRGSGGLIVVEQVDSTQHLGRRIVEEYSREGIVVPDTDVLAWCQSAGRGRQGRFWSSPPGHGVYATLVRSLPGSDLQPLPLLVAVALCEALNRHLDGRCRLKWPNDLLVGTLKLGGILIEAVTGEQGAMVAIGVGVNHSPDLAAFGEVPATSLHHEALAAPALAELAAELLAAVDRELAAERGAQQIVARYQELSLHQPGDEMRVRTDDKAVEGCFLGFDENAFLRLEVGGEERRLATGEVLAGG